MRQACRFRANFIRMRWKSVLLCFAAGACLHAQSRAMPLDAAHLKLTNVKAEQTTWKGRACLRVTDVASGSTRDGERYAVLDGSEFHDGVIDLDVTGDTLPNAPPLARGFTGFAFRLDGGKYECFYLRPKNGRARDQEQRNHSAQYVSEPEFPWQKLRSGTPSRYETYVDLVPGEWTHVKIEVTGDQARLYVNGAMQPTLIVNDLKHGAASKGALALWIGPGTVAHFADLKVATR